MEKLNKIAPTRDAYGKELEEMGSEYADIVVLEAYISKSTRI